MLIGYTHVSKDNQGPATRRAAAAPGSGRGGVRAQLHLRHHCVAAGGCAGPAGLGPQERLPKSTPRRPGKPGQNRDSRDGVFDHPESQVGPLPRVGLYARVSTPHQHTIGCSCGSCESSWNAVAGRRSSLSKAGGPRCRRGRLRIQAASGERPSTFGTSGLA